MIKRTSIVKVKVDEKVHEVYCDICGRYIGLYSWGPHYKDKSHFFKVYEHGDLVLSPPVDICWACMKKILNNKKAIVDMEV